MSKMFTAILIGIAIGVLIAPDKGSVTVNRLSDFLSDITDGLRNQADNFLDNVKETADNFQAKL